TRRCNFACLPLWSLADIDDVLDRIRPEGPIRTADVRVVYTQEYHRIFTHQFEMDAAEVLTHVEQRFLLLPDTPPDARFQSFRIVPHPTSPSALTVEGPTASYRAHPPDLAAHSSFEWKLPFERYWVVDLPPANPYVVERPFGARPFTVWLGG